MAYGNEVVLGFVGIQAVTAALASLGVYRFLVSPDGDPVEDPVYELGDLDDPDSEDNWIEYGLDDKIQEALQTTPIAQAVKACHTQALEDAGFQTQGNSGRLWYVKAVTPLGPREFSPWGIELFYDPGEMGHTAKDIVLGVALSGRYVPTFLDWKDAHGTLEPVRFNSELNDMTAIARKRLEEAWPYLAQADLMVVSKHY